MVALPVGRCAGAGAPGLAGGVGAEAEVGRGVAIKRGRPCGRPREWFVSGLFVFAGFFELSLEGVDGEVDGFFEGVGGLRCEEVGGLRDCELDAGFFVHGRFGFDDLECDFGVGDFLVVLKQLFHFFVDKLLQLVGCVEMNGFDFDFHSQLPPLIFLCPWVGEFIIGFQFAQSDVGVDLRGGERFVAEQVFDAAEIGAAVEHGGGEAVSQHVGAELAVCAGGGERLVYGVVDERGVEGLSVASGEESAARAVVAVAQAAVGADPVGELVAKGDDAFLVALAAHFELALGGVDVVVEQADELGASHAGLVEHHDDEAVAHGGGVGGVDVAVEQGVEVALAHHGGQAFGQSRQFDVGCGVVGGLPAGNKPFEEGAQGLHASPQGARAVAGVLAVDEPSAHCGERGVCRVVDAVVLKVAAPQLQVIAVGQGGVPRLVEFQPDIAQKVVNRLVHELRCKG